MFNCPHTGVALAGLIKLLKAGKIDRSEHAVVISTAHASSLLTSRLPIMRGHWTFLPFFEQTDRITANG